MEREKLIATVTAAQNGDGDALNELFNAFYNDVYYFALKTVKDDDLACDITQETFVEIINTIGDLHEPAAFVKWMKQITYHQCTRYFKKKKDVLVDEDEEGNTIFDTLKEDKTEFIPDEALDQQDFRDTILAMLDELSEEQRSATMLYYYDELSVKQIAEIQNVSEGTVKSRLNYARKSIKNSVENYEKKNGVKLHCAGVLPLLLWLLSQTGKETMPAAAANTVAGGVTTATGVAVSVAASAGGAAVATATVATTAASGASIAAKIAALPVIAKVIAGVVAGSLALGGVGLAMLPEKTPVPPTDFIIATGPFDSQDTTDQTQQTEVTHPTETVCFVPDGCTYTTADGTVLTAGQAMPETTGEGDVFTTEEYTYTYLPSGWEVKVNDTTKSLYGTILSQVNHQPVTSMQKAFAGCSNLFAAPEIPGTIINMQSAFFECTSLPAAPVIPEGVKDMSIAFAHCTALISAPVIPEGVTDMSSAFWGCTSLTSAPVIPKSVADVTWMFYGCTSLATAPVIPEGVTDLSHTFTFCSSLTTAPVIPESVTNMHETFGNCTSLTAAPAIPEGVTDMSITFAFCSSLTTAPVIPESVTNLSGTFWNCTSLTAAPVIPEGVTNMSMTFWGCTSLTGIIEINGVQKVCEFCEYYADNEVDYVPGFDCEYCGNDGVTCENCDVCSTTLECFKDTVLPITLVGSSPCLSELAATGNNGNVKLEADTVYSQADAANSIQLGESRLHNWPDFGENQTAMTDFTWTYTISTSQVPVCRVRSVEAIRANLGGSPCEIYQTSSSEKAWAIVNKYGAAFAIETDLLTVIQIKSPSVLMDKTTQYLDMVFEIILRFTLENGQVMDLRYTDDVVWFGSGGILMDCTTEDF